MVESPLPFNWSPTHDHEKRQVCFLNNQSSVRERVGLILIQPILCMQACWSSKSSKVFVKPNKERSAGYWDCQEESAMSVTS